MLFCDLCLGLDFNQPPVDKSIYVGGFLVEEQQQSRLALVHVFGMDEKQTLWTQIKLLHSKQSDLRANCSHVSKMQHIV